MPQTLFGYEVLSRLGEGAASTIYVVSEPKTRQVYALKHMICRTDRDMRYVEQAKNEYEVSQQFRHPALRRCVDLKLKRSLLGKVRQAALVMELVDGATILEHPIKDIPGILDCFIQTAQALAALHFIKYVHCDLKPNNILRTPQGKIKLIDFGQACFVETVKPRIQGTPDFIAPEQVKCRPVSIRTDVFNFGATLYWALTGRRIPTLYTVHKSERSKLTNQEYPTPRDLNPQAPEVLSRLVMACVRMKPAERPADMAQILSCLEPLAEEYRRES